MARIVTVEDTCVEPIHTFAGNPFDRADAARRDAEWLASAVRASTTRYLPLWQLNVLVHDADGLRLGWLSSADVARLDVAVAPVFLGRLDDVAHFALDVSGIGDPVHELNLDDAWRFDDARAAAMRLPIDETGILAQARAQVGWHRSHRHCSACGAATRSERGGHVRICDACKTEHFPRTDPVAIMLILDGDRCLLGQSQGRLASTGMYSALAGFIDQGESIEEAVRREIREEAGVLVGAVRYHSSQPWPFPSSLMIGCHGRALTNKITIDPAEMADVRWFPRGDVQAALNGEHPKLRVPGPIAIAHHLIRAWADGDVDV
jgi:NAD+ diphosphatase